MAQRTYPELSAQTTVQDADLLATWRPAESGPLKKLQSSVYKAYVLADQGTAAMADIGTSGATVPLLDGANTWSAAQTFPTGTTGVTVAPGTSSTALATTEFTALAVAAAAPPGNIYGLALSAAGATATFGIAAGVATDSTNVAALSLATAYTKTGSAWAVGSGSGGIDTGSIANNSWYHVYLIRRPDTGVMDVVFSLNAATPALPANYTQYRRIGSMLTNGSAQWLKFTQVGDNFVLDVVLNNFASSVGTSATLITVTSPLGIRCIARVRAFSSGGTALLLVSSPLESDQAAGVQNISLSETAGTANGTASLDILTNTSSQIRAISSTGSTGLNITTYGWIDTRGRFG